MNGAARIKATTNTSLTDTPRPKATKAIIPIMRATNTDDADGHPNRGLIIFDDLQARSL